VISFVIRSLLLVFVSVSALAQSALPPLPPLTSPATDEHLPGKFVWADLFSSNIDASRQFYEGLFSWEFRWISEPPQPYGIFSVDGYDVAGLAFREVSRDQPYSRWVHYISVADVGATESVVTELGGRTLLRRQTADRGEFAIFASPNQNLLGAIHSSSGDPEDVQALFGEWIWHQLYVRDLASAVKVLSSLTNYEIADAEAADEVDKLLISDGYARAGLAQLPAGSDASPTWLGFVRVENLPDTLAIAIRLGGSVMHQADDASMAIITDPNGALIGLLQWQYPQETEQ